MAEPDAPTMTRRKWLWRRARDRRVLLLLPTLVLAVWAAGWVISTTHYGANDAWAGDAQVYLGMAHNLQHGRGPTVPFPFDWDTLSPNAVVHANGAVPSAHYPPGYPMVLATIQTLRIAGPDGSARLLDIACVFANVVLLGLLAARLTAYRSIVAATAPVAIVLFISDTRRFGYFFEMHGWLLGHRDVASEPLFTVLFTAGLLTLGHLMTARGERRRAALVALTVITAAATLVRYSGFALIATAVVVLLVVDRRHPWRDRAVNAATVAGGSLAPVALFAVWTRWQGGSSASPFLDGFQPRLRELGAFLVRLVLGEDLSGVGRDVVLLVMVGVVVGACVLTRHALSDRSGSDGTPEAAAVMLRIAIAACLAYVAVLIVARNFFDRTVPVNPRLLAPMRGVLCALVVAAIYEVGRRVTRPAIAGSLLAGCVAVLLWHGSWLRDPAALEHPASGRRVASPEENALAGTVSPQDLIVTNVPDVVWLVTGNRPIEVPRRLSYLTGRVNPKFDQYAAQIVALLQRHGGYVFWTASGDPLLTPTDLARRLTMRPIAKSEVETLYRVEPATK